MTPGVSIDTTTGSVPAAVPASPPETSAAQRIGVPCEVFPGEKRVATVPEVVQKLIKLGFSVAVVPRANAPKKPIEGLTIHAVERVEEAMDVVRGLG